MADAISDATNIAKDFIPSLSGGGSTILSWGAWIIIFLIIVSLTVFGVWMFLKFMKYNKIIKIYEKINGKFEHTKTDRAMEVKFSTGGDTIFYLKKHKKFLPNPSLQTGRRVYLYWVREDGEWINFEFGDFDEQAKKLGAKFLDKEMRYARTQVQKGLKDRYDQPGFWKQYGLLVFSIAFITIIGVMTFLLFDKWIEGLKAVPAILDQLSEVLDRSDSILGKLDNICTGSGIR